MVSRYLTQGIQELAGWQHSIFVSFAQSKKSWCHPVRKQSATM